MPRFHNRERLFLPLWWGIALSPPHTHTGTLKISLKCNENVNAKQSKYLLTDSYLTDRMLFAILNTT